MLHKTCSSALILALVVFSVTGCGRSKVPGRGTVTYEGKPLAWAMVTFTPTPNEPGSRVATAQTNVDGRFELLTLGEKGILPGDYIVTVSKDIKDEGPQSVANWKKKHAEGGKEPVPEEGLYNVVSVVPKKYTTTRESGIEITISDKGDKDIKIELLQMR